MLAPDLYGFVIFRCVIGSQAYGLSREVSDTDRRGIYLPPASLEWSLEGVPEQIENVETQECYWELKKFLLLALKANPNILECLYSPIIEHRTEIADSILTHRRIFLSKLVYQTYSGYAASQFRRIEQDHRTLGAVNWKHVMHLIRVLLQGISILRNGEPAINVGSFREELLAIRDGLMPWAEITDWRQALAKDFDTSLEKSSLPDSPDYNAANRLLVDARAATAKQYYGS